MRKRCFPAQGISQVNTQRFAQPTGKSERPAPSYTDWVKAAIPKVLDAPGITEVRGYRPATGSSQVVATYGFPDMATWAE